MKRKILIALAIALGVVAIIGTGVLAFDAAKARQHGAQIAQMLNLTAEQKSQIKPILLDAKAKAQAIKADSALSADQKKAKFMELRASVKAQIAQILTPEQKQKFMQSRKQGRGGKWKTLAVALGITDQQKAQIKPIFNSAKAQCEAVREDSSLTAGQKQAKMMDIRKSVKDEVLPILTPEQKQKLAAMRASEGKVGAK